MQFDVAIVGGGPVGLAFAREMAGSGLSLAVIETQPEARLADPGFDGREIALTHLSQDLMRALGAWDHLPAGAASALREARVLNGGSPYALHFDVSDRAEAALGQLVPNHLIRRALFAATRGQAELTLLAGTSVTGATITRQGARLALADGREVAAKLVVAADTRFSPLRKAQRIEADVTDFAKSMLVCRLEHEGEHGHVATEWFDNDQTIAMLPLNGRCSSAVITLPKPEIERLAALDGTAFSAEVTERYRNRLGAMRLVSSRHTYPLVTTYARRFVAPRFALIGDAAVGMHPVTAHGFNLGLRGAHTLAEELRGALARGADLARAEALDAPLAAYESRHRRATWPLYTGTNLLAKLYTDERAPARLARHAALRLGNRLTPFKHLIRGMLMESDGPRPSSRG
ncbi:MAG: FAD-dependent hydroxylase [Azospirillum brasilense]|nr:MAG: FAD-dependent hydroxylase [Azospirillum brasilense]